MVRSLPSLLLAFVILAACDSAGRLIAYMLGLPVPGTVIGILLLLMGFILLRYVPGQMQRMAEFMLAHLNLFYVPAGVGVMGYLALLSDDLWPIVVALFASTFLAMLAAAFAFRWMARLTGLPEDEEAHHGD